jgi:probable phosphoglycerate mutase
MKPNGPTALIFLIRHGETQWSITGRHTGRTDLPLTGNGEHCATLLRARLQGIAFTCVLTSPLLRARRTCALAGLGAKARVEPGLAEWDYGDYEGRTTVDILAHRPGWNVFQDGCPRGESAEQVSQRADRLLAGLRLMGGTIALFSHGQFLRALAMRWIGLPVRESSHFALDPAALSILGYEHHGGEIPAILLWNSGSDGAFGLPETAGSGPGCGNSALGPTQ